MILYQINNKFSNDFLTLHHAPNYLLLIFRKILESPFFQYDESLFTIINRERKNAPLGTGSVVNVQSLICHTKHFKILEPPNPEP